MTRTWIGRRATWFVIGLGVAACGGAARPGATGPGAGSGSAMTTAAAPAAMPSVDSIEARLLGERAIDLQFQIESKGAHAAKVEGQVLLAHDNRARWRVSGTFDGQPVSIDRVFDASAGAHLTEAVVIGWTRMGLLHNIARLTAGQGVERAGGGIADWLAAPLRDARADAVTMETVVEGHAMGEATLELDSLGLPAHRVQTVKFDTGPMTVEERYSVRVPEELGPDAFSSP